MTYPAYLQCTECGYKLKFPSTDRSYYLGDGVPNVVADDQILVLLLKPCWCFNCNSPSWIEDIPEIDVLERLWLAVKSGQEIQYPVYSQFIGLEETHSLLSQYIELSMNRGLGRHCIICNGSNHIVLDGNPVKLRHEYCDYGVYKPVYTISSCNGPMKKLMYNLEGKLMGSLGHWVEELNGWNFYPVVDGEQS